MEGKSDALRGLLYFFNSYSVCWSPTSRVKFSIPSCTGLNRKGWETGRAKLYHLIRTDVLEFMVQGKLQYLEILFQAYYEDNYRTDSCEGGIFNNSDSNIIWSCLFKLHLIVATVKWNIALFISSLKSTRNWAGWRIRWPGSTKALSWIWMELFEYYSLPSQQSSRKPQAFQKRARSQTEFPAWRGPSVTHFGSVSNHFPKKFHFYGKFLSPCSTSNKIIWDLGRNEGKVGRGKAETYKNMSVESLCSLVGMNRFFCFLGFFFVCVFYFYISKILL